MLDSNKHNEAPTHQPRRSACASESERHQIEKWKGTTIEERIHAALTMSQRFRWLNPVKEKREHGKK